MAHDIFLSYSRKDKVTMQLVKREFLNANLGIWTDEGINIGTPSWKRSIDDAIKGAKAFVCIASPDAKKSKWVQAEIDQAELYNIPVYLILANGEPSQSIPFGYGSHQWIDIRNPTLYDTQVKDLITIIKTEIGIEDDKPEFITKSAILSHLESITWDNERTLFISYSTISPLHGTWNATTGGMKLIGTEDRFWGDYDWQGKSLAGHISGRIIDNIALFRWKWDFSSEKGVGFFRFDNEAEKLNGGWFYDSELDRLILAVQGNKEALLHPWNFRKQD